MLFNIFIHQQLSIPRSGNRKWFSSFILGRGHPQTDTRGCREGQMFLWPHQLWFVWEVCRPAVLRPICLKRTPGYFHDSERGIEAQAASICEHTPSHMQFVSDVLAGLDSYMQTLRTLPQTWRTVQMVLSFRQKVHSSCWLLMTNYIKQFISTVKVWNLELLVLTGQSFVSHEARRSKSGQRWWAWVALRWDEQVGWSKTSVTGEKFPSYIVIPKNSNSNFQHQHC